MKSAPETQALWPMKPRSMKTWYRQAIVTACLAVLILLGLFTYFMLRQNEGSAEAEGRLLGGGAMPVGVTGVSDASGGLRLCNKTPSRVGVAIGYKLSRQWTTEGWWNVPAGSCEILMGGPLVSRFYYVFAIDYDQGGTWGGKTTMCTRDKMFTIKGFEDCVARGFNPTGFFEVDTGEQKSWTVQLTEPGQQGTGG